MDATTRTESLEDIANRVAPNGSRAAQMKAAKARAKQAAFTASRPQPEPAEPTQAQQDALSAYIAAREEWEGLRDDIEHGSAEECRAAHQHIRQASVNYDHAGNEARRLGVIEAGRKLFR
jgi:hypothetical protein